MHQEATRRGAGLVTDRRSSDHSAHAAEIRPQRATLLTDAPAANELDRRVKNFLAGRNQPGLRKLEVSSCGNAVTLSGTLRSFYEKQLALHCCRRVAGVVEVIDEIEVADAAAELCV